MTNVIPLFNADKERIDKIGASLNRINTLLLALKEAERQDNE